jgi:hypothetical protein
VSPARLLLPALATVALLAAGCGSSGETSSRSSTAQQGTATATTPPAPPGASVRACQGTVAGTRQVRVTGVGCDVARGVVASWANNPRCSPAAGVSRVSCGVYSGEYRCLGATTDRGLTVSCARKGSSVAFFAKHG